MARLAWVAFTVAVVCAVVAVSLAPGISAAGWFASVAGLALFVAFSIGIVADGQRAQKARETEDE